MSTTSQQLLNRMLMVLGAVLIVATGAAFAARDDHSSGTQAQPATRPATSVDEVQIADFLFKPEAVTVAVGTTITFTNDDSAPHTATSGLSPNPDGVFDTDVLKKGESKAIKLTRAGTFAYYCALHPFMKATVIVK